LIGGIPFGYLLVKLTTGKDVRAAGSGNIGATNVLRTTGRGVAVATLLLDIAKGYGAVWLAAWLTNDSAVWTSAAALAVMAGHAFPIFLGFKGGKAVASFIGAFLYLTPLPLIAVMLVLLWSWLRRGNLGGIDSRAATFPLGVWMILHPSIYVFLASLIAGAFIVVRHRENIDRLRGGTENVFSWKRKR